MIIKNLLQKMKTIEEKKNDVLTIKRFSNDDLKMLIDFVEIKTRMKHDSELIKKIVDSAYAMRRTYAVLAHDLRISSIDITNQKTAIDYLIRQNVTLHENMKIMRMI